MTTVSAGPRRFPYETGATHLKHHEQALNQQLLNRRNPTAHKAPSPWHLRTVSQVSLVEDPIYKDKKHKRWVAALGRGSSYEFCLFDGGLRQFLYHLLQADAPDPRNWFAVAEEGRPAHFYMDIEEPDPSPDCTAERFFCDQARVALWFVQMAMEAIYGISLDLRKPKPHWLCASDVTKQSFHTHVNEWTWEDVEMLHQAMQLCKKALDTLRQQYPDHPLVRALLRRKPNSDKDIWYIIDFSVYTPRRKFRMAFQAKPESKRVLLPWDADTLERKPHESVERWLRWTCLLPRRASRHCLLPGPDTSTAMHQELYQISCTSDLSPQDFLQRVYDTIRVGYYDGSKPCAVSAVALSRVPRDACPRWALAQRILWNSGARRLNDPLYHWDATTNSTLPHHIHLLSDTALCGQFRVAGWFREDPLPDATLDLYPKTTPHQQCVYRTLCLRVLYHWPQSLQGITHRLLTEEYERTYMLSEENQSSDELEFRRQILQEQHRPGDDSWTEERRRLVGQVMPMARMWFQTLFEYQATSTPAPPVVIPASRPQSSISSALGMAPLQPQYLLGYLLRKRKISQVESVTCKSYLYSCAKPQHLQHATSVDT